MKIALCILIGTVTNGLSCPNEEDYRPCYCVNYVTGEFEIICDRVSLADVFNVFKRTTPANWYGAKITLSPIDLNQAIPADLLGKHRVTFEISIICQSGSIANSLIIDANAFRSSRNTAQWFYSRDCDLSQLDFDFLDGFHKINLIQLSDASNVHLANWTSMPPLHSLEYLNLFNARGLNEWTEFPNLVRGLKQLIVYDPSGIQDGPTDRILSWTLKSSLSTLETLGIEHSDLTSIPWQVPLFKKLKELRFNDQKTGIASLLKGSLNFSVPVYNLNARNSGIETIEAGTFQGTYLFDKMTQYHCLNFDNVFVSNI